ncbi:MAG: sensor histidine kinase [Planctomycetota bacterium]|nr:MAG: sensor histidine kinase [Planctomycetota bacterium]REK37389.1 MAG: sensor histidine kinase [Planctomycetota bacterium]
MPRLNRQIVCLALMIGVPLALLTWLGVRLAQRQEQEARERYRQLQAERLRDVDRTIAKVLAARERELLEVLDRLPLEREAIRDVVRRTPQVDQVFVLASTGKLQHPDPAGETSTAERRFLTAFGDVLLSGDLVDVATSTGATSTGATSTRATSTRATLTGATSPRATSPGAAPQQLRQSVPPPTRQSKRGQGPSKLSGKLSGKASRADAEWQVEPPPATATHGWYTWYWGRGLHLIFWSRRPGGEIVGILLQRARWMSDLVAELPDTALRDSRSAATQSFYAQASRRRGEEEPTPERVRLLDSGGNVVYQWGRLAPPPGAEPFAELALSSPLAAWRLQYYMPEQSFAAAGNLYLSVLSSLTVVGVALVALAVFIYREQRRNLREAAQRVNFVNQVSHELKTPLTNVRMYAELLQSDLEMLDDQHATSQVEGRLSVIVSESQRLSRLIGNVLTFARGQREQLRLRPRAAAIEEIVERVAEQFRLPLADKGIEIVRRTGSGPQVSVDSDAVEQILVNLLSNVEKYASGATQVEIDVTQQHDTTTIVVADDGPGLDALQGDKIFQPFYRGTDRLEDAAGTGIGLSIARQLARLHGGDLELVPSDVGARFDVRLRTPAVDGASTAEQRQTAESSASRSRGRTTT